MSLDYTSPGGSPLERLAQQQAGNHPAPCARSCEANAYEIEIRRVSAERDEATRRSRLAERNLLDAQEAGKKMAKQAFDAERERDDLVAKLKDAEHDRDEFRRVMNGFAAKLAELEGQEPVAWIYDWQAPEGLTRDWSTNNAAEIPEGATNIRPLFARQVPAEPVNVRLLEAMKRAKSALVSFKFVPEHANCWEESDEEDLAAIDGAIAAADAQQERLLPVTVPTEPVNARLLTALKACRHKFAHYVAHHIGKGDMHKAMANEAMVAMADVAIMAAEAAPRVARLTHPDIAKALASAGLKPEDYRDDGEIFPLVVAIESAALRKNGLALED